MSEVLKSSVSGLCRDATNIRPVADSECSTWKTLETDPFSPKKKRLFEKTMPKLLLVFPWRWCEQTMPIIVSVFPL